MIDESEEDCDEDIEEMKHPVANTLSMCMEKVSCYFRENLGNESNLSYELQRVITQAIFSYFDEQTLKTNTKHVHFVLAMGYEPQVLPSIESLVDRQPSAEPA
jgi:hypothetical protein